MLVIYLNIPGTRGGPGDRMLAVKSRKTPENKFFWGETKFQPREFPQSGSKALGVKKERERAKIVNNNGQLRIINSTSGGARKPPGPKMGFSMKVVTTNQNCTRCRSRYR